MKESEACPHGLFSGCTYCMKEARERYEKMNSQPQRMIRIFFNGGYSDSKIGEDFNLAEVVAKMQEDGYLVFSNGDGYFPVSEIKAMFIYRANTPPAEVINFPGKG